MVVDAPCSGLGTLRRDPDIKWRRTAADLRALRRPAARLSSAARPPPCAPGGRLVYTTCSTEPEENEQVVARALAAAAGFRIAATATAAPVVAPFVGADGMFRTEPARHGLDGYFGVVLARAGGPLAPGKSM